MFKKFHLNHNGYDRNVQFVSLFKATGLVVLAPLMVLIIMTVYGRIAPMDAVFAMLFTTVIAIMFVKPYIANLSALTSYVRQLALGEDAPQPNLSFLNNVEELSQSVEQLHITWNRNRQKLESMIEEGKQSQKMLTDFVANASHEIRTPLTSVAGLIETIQTTAKNDLPAQEKFLNIMQAETQRMSQLVDGLLSLSHIERHINSHPTQAINVVAILRDVQSSLSVLADEYDITINLSLCKKLPKIIGDTGEVRQVLENLVSNAVKYGSAGSTVTIITKLTKASSEQQQMLNITITDEGEGIAEEHIDRITQRFYRIDKARSRAIGGTGLGLAIVKYIMERHRGTLEIQSTIGVGSSFSVKFPIFEEQL